MKAMTITILCTVLSGLILSVYGAIQDIGIIKDRTKKNREDILEVKKDIREDIIYIRHRVDTIVDQLK